MARQSFEEGTKITPLSSHTYSANFHSDWCIGNVPHGGFITSCFLRTAAVHFASTLSTQSQPHALSLHIDFLRRTQTGPATFTVTDTKLGRQTSVIHVTLTQDSRTEVVGYITHTNLAVEQGLSVATHFALQPAPAPVDFRALVTDTDAFWGRAAMPHDGFRRAQAATEFFLPRERAVEGVGVSFVDEWIRWADGGRWTAGSLGYVVDTFPMLIERWMHGDKYRGGDGRAVNVVAAEGKKKWTPKYWYPTLLLNLEVKKALPEEGVEWLFVRARAKQIRDGRMDLEVVVLDVEGELVAVSHHVGFVLGVERNTGARRVEGGSKI